MMTDCPGGSPPGSSKVTLAKPVSVNLPVKSLSDWCNVTLTLSSNLASVPTGSKKRLLMSAVTNPVKVSVRGSPHPSIRIPVSEVMFKLSVLSSPYIVRLPPSIRIPMDPWPPMLIVFSPETTILKSAKPEIWIPRPPSPSD